MNKSTKYSNNNEPKNDDEYGYYFEINSLNNINHIFTTYDLITDKTNTFHEKNLTIEELHSFLFTKFSNKTIKKKFKILN